jgi:hypothetical protein
MTRRSRPLEGPVLLLVVLFGLVLAGLGLTMVIL